MFNGCTSLNVDQYANSQTGASMKFGSNWSTAPITNVNHMFSNCTSLNYNNGPDFLVYWCSISFYNYFIVSKNLINL